MFSLKIIPHWINNIEVWRLADYSMIVFHSVCGFWFFVFFLSRKAFTALAVCWDYWHTANQMLSRLYCVLDKNLTIVFCVHNYKIYKCSPKP